MKRTFDIIVAAIGLVLLSPLLLLVALSLNSTLMGRFFSDRNESAEGFVRFLFTSFAPW